MEKMKKLSSNVYFQLLLIILSITGINGLVIFQIIGDIRLFVEIILVTTILVLIAYTLHLGKKKRTTEEDATKPILERIGETFLNGSSKLITLEENDIHFGVIEDEMLKISSVDCEYRLSFTETGNMLVKRQYQGINLGDDPSLYISSFAGGDHSISDKQFLKRFEAHDSEGNNLSMEIIKGWSTGNVKPFKLYFATPIESGKPFDMELQYYWPACISRSPDGILFWNKYFRKGVDKLHITIESPIKFKNCKMERITVKERKLTKETRGVPQPHLDSDRSLPDGPFYYTVTITKAKNYYFEFEY